MQTAKCPVCRSDVIVGDEIYRGDMENCSNCEAELEVVSLHPLQLREINEELAPEK